MSDDVKRIDMGVNPWDKTERLTLKRSGEVWFMVGNNDAPFYFFAEAGGAPLKLAVLAWFSAREAIDFIRKHFKEKGVDWKAPSYDEQD